MMTPVDRLTVEQGVAAWIADATHEATRANEASFSTSVRANHVILFGHIPEGASEPSGGIDTWLVTLELWFPNQGPPDDPRDTGLAIARVLDAMSDGIDADPTLGQRVHRATWSGTDGNEPTQPGGGPEGMPERVEAYMRVTYLI